jgi:uncharacterized SAM-binding protein YcdF (DUF218 family)
MITIELSSRRGRMKSIFFYVSKISWKLAAPDSLLLIIIGGAWLLLILKRSRIATWLLGILTVALVFVAFFPVGEWTLYPLEKRFSTAPALPDSVDGIVVLGGAADPVRSTIWGQLETGDAAERYHAFLSLARRFPDARLVFTGGTGSLADQEYSEADAAGVFFEQQGLDASRLIIERDSRNTYENAVLTKALVSPMHGENWVLITTAWHMPRSVGIFRQAGWPILPYPVDHWTEPGRLFRVEYDLAEHLRNLKIGTKEWMGLVAYRLTGKTSSFLPHE